MNQALQEAQRYLAEFERSRARLPGGSVPWVREGRGEAIARFAEAGFPTTRDEDWKYTNLAPLAKRELALATGEGTVDAAALGRAALPGLEAHTLVYVNGWFRPELSRLLPLPGGASVASLASRLEAGDSLLESCWHGGDATGGIMSVLNRAFAADGALIHVPAGVALDAPIHLLYLGDAAGQGAMWHPRTVIRADAGAKLTVIESFVGIGDAAYFTNAVTQVHLGENAVVDRYKVQRESGKAWHVATTDVRQAKGSRFASHCISLGGQLSRNDLQVRLEGEGASCTLNGLYLAGGRQHMDNHTRLDHLVPNCTSREVYKGVLDGHGRGVFNGRILVWEDAQKTDARLTNNNLLLSPDAEVDTKPQLEIFADDVKCAHGATVGQLDPGMIFYLRSRAVDEETARNLLTYAFANEVVHGIAIEPLRDMLEDILVNRLGHGQAAIKESA